MDIQHRVRQWLRKFDNVGTSTFEGLVDVHMKTDYVSGMQDQGDKEGLLTEDTDAPSVTVIPS